MRALPGVRRSTILAVCALVFAASGSASDAWAATLSVTTLDDSGPGSLRQAIADAAAGDTITFGVYGTVTLTSGALTINKNLSIEGPGPQQLKISGNNASRVFVILSGNVTLAGMTISDGLADANSPIVPGIGGAILNGTPPPLSPASLILSDVIVSDNQALGSASKSPLSFPGGAFGGGVANLGTLAVNSSSFIDNLAQGGDGSSPHGADRPLAGFAGGGAITNYGMLTITGSRFSHNQAVGGNNTTSQFLSGHGLGGALASGSAVSTLVVSGSEFDHNQAIGGNGNISPVPATIGPNKASGGAIDVTGGTATLDNCTLDHNWSVGGAGASGSPDGGIGAGGAIVATNFGGLGTNVTISDSKVEHNIAIGGPGAPGGNGGEGEGGGLTSTAGAILTVIGTTVAHNHAQGGEGVNGGNGLGGGLYDANNVTTPPPPGSPATQLILQGAIVSKNLALGGEAEDGGSHGEGIGGGVYYLGTYSADNTTVIEKNQASTSNDNVWP
jgi:hypothetical protein